MKSSIAGCGADTPIVSENTNKQIGKLVDAEIASIAQVRSMVMRIVSAIGREVNEIAWVAVFAGALSVLGVGLAIALAIALDTWLPWAIG